MLLELSYRKKPNTHFVQPITLQDEKWNRHIAEARSGKWTGRGKKLGSHWRVENTLIYIFKRRVILDTFLYYILLFIQVHRLDSRIHHSDPITKCWQHYYVCNRTELVNHWFEFLVIPVRLAHVVKNTTLVENQTTHIFKHVRTLLALLQIGTIFYHEPYGFPIKI